jgi:hypothetical protein
MDLWHVSDQPQIERFEPRLPPPESTAARVPVVWAVAESHLVNYLVPRECPRVCMRATAATQEADIERFLGLGQTHPVVVVEAHWVERVASTPLWLYAMPSEHFELEDLNAGYYVSRKAVSATRVIAVTSPKESLRNHGAELWVVPRLREFAAEVAASTLSFSIIRLRNAP